MRSNTNKDVMVITPLNIESNPRRPIKIVYKEGERRAFRQFNGNRGMDVGLMKSFSRRSQFSRDKAWGRDTSCVRTVFLQSWEGRWIDVIPR